MATLDPAQLEALSAAVSEGTLEAAARSLHVTPSAVSQRIKALEVSVGRVLLVRTKPIAATAAGEVLVRLARQIQALTADVAHELGGADDVAAVVPLAVNADSLSTWVLPALASVGPPLVFDLHREDEARTADLLRAGTVMAAVSAAHEAVPGCTVERLGSMRYRPTSSKAFAARWFPDGVTPQALSLAPVLVFDRNDHMQDGYLRHRSRRPIDPPRHHVPGSVEFAMAVAAGLGWGMLPDLQTGTMSGRADLVDLDPRGGLDVHLYWQQWRLRSAALDRVAAAIRGAAAAVLG
jgi:LysR family transcriptional regulator, chromosome initiation inhibitor